MVMLKPIVEDERLVSVSREPHAVATDGRAVWISSRVTRRVDVMERDGWRKTGELEPPGMPWGMTYALGEVVMTCGEGGDDTRRIRRYRSGVLLDGFIPCPGDTGSHLGFVNGELVLGQWYNQKLLMLSDDGSVARSYDTPHQVCGVAIVDGAACILGTDEEEEGAYYLSRLDLASGQSRDLALVPFRARGLAWDGSRFWTNHREADRTVTFTLPA
jgi:hypothetical protein